MTSPTFRLPAEWEPQAGVLLAWPHADTDWAPRLAEVETCYLALLAAIAHYELVLLCIPNERIRTRVENFLKSAAVNLARVRFITIAYDDTWLRDSGPITLTDGNQFRINDYRFTGWGGKFEAHQDDRLIEGLFERGLFRAEHSRIDWALEGGGIESDGAGTVLTTWQCLHERHPELSQEQITKNLSETLGANRVLWLQHGHLQGDDTDAHIDTLARFAPDNGIVFQACDDPNDAHHAALALMQTELEQLRTPDLKSYTLHALPWPKAIYDNGRRLAASYANYLIINDAVLVPSYDDPADAAAVSVIRRAYPGRQVITIPCRPLIWQNGSLHCVTMQLPRGVLA